MNNKVIYGKGDFSLEDMDGPVDFSKIIALPKDQPNYLKLIGREPTGLMEPEEGYNHIANCEIFKLFAIKTRVIDAKPADTSFNLFGKTFKAPIICSAMPSLGMEMMKALAKGRREANSIMGVGISSKKQLEEILSVSVSTIKHVKPFKNFDMLMNKVKHAENAEAMAVGCDVIYGFGAKFGERVFFE